MKNILISCFSYAIIFVSINSFAQTANPTRPSAADNAYLTELGYSELEIGYSGDKETYSVPALLKVTPFKMLEVGVLMNGVINYDGNKTKVGDPGFQLKYQLVNNNDLAAAFVGRVQFNSSSSLTYTFYAVPTIQTKFAQFDLTAGTSFIKSISEYKDQYFYALAVSPKINMPAGIFMEVYGDSFFGTNSFYFDIGIAYPVTPDFILDIGVAMGLNENSGNWIFQIGLTKTLFKFIN